ncbi:MAG TPA: N-formylglutamate amidohydrolase [Candidatus Polarisedimenticolia bacterium]|nr:N-formylglutamate amidohydrolase [Candidatus Polarisedimenticolia bacterium]
MSLRAVSSLKSIPCARPSTPLVLTCEHASNRLPRGCRPRTEAERALLHTHWAWDIGAWEVARRLARRLGAAAVGGGVSRLVVDLNRPVVDPSLVRREAGWVKISWNARLLPLEIERRMHAFHLPYHDAIDRAILRLIVRGARPLLLSVHSFTPVYEGRRREFDMGVLFDRSRGHAERLLRGLRREGFEVRENEPYSGIAGMMYSIHRHGTHHDLPCLELEMNQALFRQRGAAARLAPKIARALAPLLALQRPGRRTGRAQTRTGS